MFGRIAFLLFSIALVAVPTGSLPQLVEDSSVNSTAGFFFGNHSPASLPSGSTPADQGLGHSASDNSSLAHSTAPFSNQAANRLKGQPWNPDFLCIGPHYFSPYGEVDCYYWDHESRKHYNYYVSMPAVDISYSTDRSRAWADWLINRVYMARGSSPEVTELQWWEHKKKNNWGRGVAVHFKTDYEPDRETVEEQVELAVRGAMCDDYTDVSFVDGGCQFMGKSPEIMGFGEGPPSRRWASAWEEED